MQLSRRNFIKAASATCAAGCLGAALGLGKSRGMFVEKAVADDTATTQKCGMCSMCMFVGCATKITVKDGIAVDVEGNPDYPVNRGTLCGRGNSVLMHTYNPMRVKTPMKRTNPKKGLDEDPGWVEISWDEALDTVASKFKEVRDNNPRELVYITGFAMKSYPMIKPFAKIFGDCNVLESNGPLCSIHYAALMILQGMPSTAVDTMRCNYFVNVGSTMGSNYGVASGGTRHLKRAHDRGMKRVVVDPRWSVEAGEGEWVPIRPGGDYAFLLGWLHTMFYEIQKYDVPFLKDHTNAPYLIGEDGFYVRGASGKPQIMDASDGIAKDFDDPALIDPAIEGSYEVGDKAATPAFVLVRESMKPFTPEWAEEKCTIPADTIRRIANDFVEEACIGQTIDINGVTLPYRPAALQLNRGALNHQNGAYADLAAKIITALVGDMDVPGGIQGCVRGAGKPSADGTVNPIFEAAVGLSKQFEYPPTAFDLHDYIPHRHSMPQLAFRVMLEPEKYGMEIKPKALFNCGANSIIGSADPDLVAESIANIPFTATIAYHMDEVAVLSDILLPEHSHLETLLVGDWTGCNNRTVEEDVAVETHILRDPIPPVYNTMHQVDIALEILKRMGLQKEMNEYFNKSGFTTSAPLTGEYMLDEGTFYTYEEILDRSLKSAYGDDKGVDYLRENGWIELKEWKDEKMYNYSYFPGRQTRYPIYFHTQYESGTNLLKNLREHDITVMGWDLDTYEKFYQPTLWWYDTVLDTAPAEYDLYAFNYKMQTSLFRLGAMEQNAWLSEWSREYLPDYDVIQLNAATAEAKGLQDGDVVVVESPWGKVQGRLKTTQACHPQSIAIAGALGRMVSTVGAKQKDAVHFNRLITGDFGTFDPIMGGIEGTVRAKIYKA